MTALLVIWHYILTILSWVVMMARKHWKIALIIVGVVFLLASGLLIRNAWINRKIAKREAQLEQVDKAVQDGRIGVDASNVEKPKQEAVNASKQSNEATKEVTNTRNTDSRNFNGDERTARERFCRNYPDDSQCRPR